jgi:Holliday junction DNA helicase RuvA
VVRELSLTLFGFADVDARELFVLQTVSGIGPRGGGGGPPRGGAAW